MIISLSGKLQSGKDTTASIIKELIPEMNWEVKKWAGKLKEIASSLTNIPLHKWESGDFKEHTLPAPWDNFTGRQFLQLLGTDAMRNNFDTEVWVKALMSQYIVSTSTIGTSEFDFSEVDVEPNWIITDTRFPNELEAVKQKGALLIKVIRSYDTNAGEHPSETQLDYFADWDYIIENTGSMNLLRSSVKDILIQEKLIQK
jgi:hypothetical protein